MEQPKLHRFNFWIDTILKTAKLILVTLTIVFFLCLPLILFQVRMAYSWKMGYESSVEQIVEEAVAPLEERIEELESRLDNSE
jgi:hypothetical protein